MRKTRPVKQAQPLDDTSWPGARVRWMLIGLVPGLAIAAALHLYNQQQQEQLSATIVELRDTLEARTEPAAPPEPDLPAPPPRFVFHEMLTSRDASVWDSFPELPEQQPGDALTRMQPGEPSLRADARPDDTVEAVDDEIDARPLGILEPVPDAPPPETDRPSATPPEPEAAQARPPTPEPEPVPEPEPEPEPASAPETPLATEAEQQRFVLQVGSFRERSDADRLRARLALLGVEASVQSGSANGGVYRVRVGPVDGRQAAERLQERLGNAGFDSILIRR